MIRSETKELLLTAPDQFVAARNALSKRLKADGDKQGAAEIAALRRGSWTDWALNVVADDDPDLTERYLDTAESVRHAQESGTGDLRTALRQLRDVSNEMIRAASQRLTDRGHTPDLLELVERLAEVGNSPAASERLRTATLTADVGGADDGAGADDDDEIFTPSAKQPNKPKPTKKPAAPPARSNKPSKPSGPPPDELRRKRLQKAVEEAQQTYDDANAELEGAEQELADAIEAVERATEAVERANAELTEARRHQIDVKKRRESARQNTVAAGKALERAAAELEKAER